MVAKVLQQHHCGCWWGGWWSVAMIVDVGVAMIALVDADMLPLICKHFS